MAASNRTRGVRPTGLQLRVIDLGVWLVRRRQRSLARLWFALVVPMYPYLSR